MSYDYLIGLTDMLLAAIALGAVVWLWWVWSNRRPPRY